MAQWPQQYLKNVSISKTGEKNAEITQKCHRNALFEIRLSNSLNENGTENPILQNFYNV